MTTSRQTLSRRGPVLLLALGAAIIAAFLGSLSGEFVLRDRAEISEREAIRIPGRIGELLIEPRASATEAPGGTVTAAQGIWRPLTSVGLGALWRIGGGRASSFRLAALLAHLTAACLAFVLARRLLRNDLLALGVAGLFGLRPSAVEAVAQVSALAEPLHTALALFAALCFLRAREGHRRGALWLAVVGFGLALLAKETALFVAVALPFARAAGDEHSQPALGSSAPRVPARRALLLFAAVLIGWFATRVLIVGAADGGLFRPAANFGLESSRALLLRLELLAFAVTHAVLPLDSVLFRPIDPYLTFGNSAFLGRLAAGLAVVVVSGWLARNRNPAALFGAAWLLAGALPMVLFPASLGPHPFRDDAIYLASFGGSLLLVVALAGLVRSIGLSEKPALVAIAALAILFGLRTHARTGVWKDDNTLFQTAARESKSAIRPQLELGRLALEDFRVSGTSPDLGRALTAFTRAQDLAAEAQAHSEQDLVNREDVLRANLGAGRTLMLQSERDGFGDFADVIELFETVAESRPDRVEPLLELAQAFLAAGDAEQSVGTLRRAIEAAPGDPRPHADLGKVLFKTGQLEEARRHLEFAAEQRPSHADDRLWLARVWLDLRNPARARVSANDALALVPNLAEAELLVGQIELREGRPEAAINILDEVLAQEPKLALAHTERGKALLTLGNTDEALLALRRACEFGTNLFEPHYLVASFLTQRELYDSARPYTLRAYELCGDLGLRQQLRGVLASGLVKEEATWVALAQVDRLRGDLSSSRDFAERALASEEPSVEALAERARVELAAGLPTDALPFLERAVRSAPERFDLAHDLALARAGVGDEAGARAELERALGLVAEAGTRAALRRSLESELRRSLSGSTSGPPLPTGG